MLSEEHPVWELWRNLQNLWAASQICSLLSWMSLQWRWWWWLILCDSVSVAADCLWGNILGLVIWGAGGLTLTDRELLHSAGRLLQCLISLRYGRERESLNHVSYFNDIIQLNYYTVCVCIYILFFLSKYVFQFFSWLTPIRVISNLFYSMPIISFSVKT